MTRSNLAVCFSPVIFRFNLEKKANLKSKLDSSTGSYSKPTLLTNHNNINPSIENNSVIIQQQNDTSNVNTVTTSQIIPLEISLSPLQNNNKSKKYLTDNTELHTTSSTTTITTASSATNTRKSSDSDAILLENNFKKQSSIELLKNNNANTNEFSPNALIEEEAHNAASSSKKQIKNEISHQNQCQQQSLASSSSKDKQNYKRKYSEKINKAASSLVNFGAELSSSKPTAFFSDSFKENLENMSKVIQLCVSDMIKYSMDLFTVNNYIY